MNKNKKIAKKTVPTEKELRAWFYSKKPVDSLESIVGIIKENGYIQLG